MKRVLIVYEVVPEDTQLYDLVVTEEQFEKITKCHGHYIGVVSDFPLECGWLIDFLSDCPPVYTSNYPEKPHVSSYPYDAVVVTGCSP